MLYQIINNKAVAWEGEPLSNGTQYPTIIEALWDKDKLEGIGLYVPDEADTVPTGYKIASTSVELVNGRPKYVNTLVADGPENYLLTARQLRLGMVRNGISLTTVDAIINSIPDEATKDEYRIYWEYTPQVYWLHPVTQALIAAVGLSTNAAAAMWMAAKDYE